MADRYDLVPYTEHAYAESSPDNLEVIARLAGFPRDPGRLVEASRVLELGCGRGGNLLPLAATWPDSTFVGVDRSARQVRDAARAAEAAGLRNVTFVAADFVDAPLSLDPFDFVLCHGVYSWIPPGARRALLARIEASLAPRGIAYVSFNTLPGWYRKLAARDWMRLAARASFDEGPRASLAWLAEQLSPEHAGARHDLRAVHARLAETDAAYLTHEYLAEEHHPVYASTFLGEAEDAGLAYLGDALPSETAPELLAESVRAKACGLGLAARQDLYDFVRDTSFRRALLVRKDAGFDATERLDASAITGLRLATRLRPDGDGGGSDLESFSGAGVTVQLSGLARRALEALAAVAPRSLPCSELASLVGSPVEALAEELKDLWLATPGIDLHVSEPAFRAEISERPRADGIARWHAVEGGPITNAWHQEVVLPEPIVRFVLELLDGTLTRSELERRVEAREKRLSPEEASEVTKASLELLARSALLVG